MVKVKWPRIIDFNNIVHRPICRWIDLGNGTMFRITAFFTYPFYDMSRDGLLIAIERVGCFLFGLNRTEFRWDYVAEKLYLPEADARIIADWMNAQCGFDFPQQGHYVEAYIREVEPYGLIGEKHLMPLIPEILTEGEKA
jgi:hypothetical protein